MTKNEIRAMLKPLAPSATYSPTPAKQLVRAEAKLDPHKLGIWLVSEVRHDHYAHALAQ